MKNKKGFTLIELLVVIAILAILAIVATPKVIELFNDAKKDVFLTEVKNLYKAAATKYTSEALKGNNILIFDSEGENKLDLDNEDLKYYITLDSNGKVNYLDASNGTYTIKTTATQADELQKSNISSEAIDTTSRPTPGIAIFGDVNNDGIVNQIDAQIILARAVGKNPSIPIVEYKFDLDCDGRATASDSLIAQEIAAGTYTGTLTQYTQCGKYKWGNVNGDNVVDALDGNMILDASVDRITVSARDKYKFDLDCDGAITANDALWAQEVAAEKRTGKFASCSLYNYVMWGDVTGDGIVSKEDKEKILSAAVGNITVSPSDKYKYDLDCDGWITATDALWADQVAEDERTGNFSSCSLY